jgi:hypothetical protein
MLITEKSIFKPEVKKTDTGKKQHENENHVELVIEFSVVHNAPFFCRITHSNSINLTGIIMPQSSSQTISPILL